ncbi:RNA polymerase sigma factor [Tundrisphaera lichenicola]|uniref:RNA polymerase sigma factor n=1 Tax=Tundrisphaera lichenicola TaxID=2029860 RepID=UPI003EBC275A
MGKGVGRAGADLVRIFEGGSAVGLTDGELLTRFADRGDPAAFEALVSRHGPMVLGACRRMLADPHDVDDAFQATFLILVRKARSIGRRELVGPWLYGVAVRTARRARSASARREARERLAVVPEAQRSDGENTSRRAELRGVIDEEIARLPDHHRGPVVLCDVEGLSREEAAERLGWTLNMVRGRLERARQRLRDQLARRGLAPSEAWMTMLAPPALSPGLMASTARAALSISVGRIGTGLASASAVALSRGVLRMMMLSKLKVGLALVLSTGFVAGSGMIAAQGPGIEQDEPRLRKTVEGATNPPPEKNAADIDAAWVEALGENRILAARARLRTQTDYYEQGRITIDRVLDASETLMDAELDNSENREKRRAVIEAHLARVKEFEKRERAEFEAGRATSADVQEIQTHRLGIEFRLAEESLNGTRQHTVEDLERRVSEVERKLDGLLNLLSGAANKR